MTELEGMRELVAINSAIARAADREHMIRHIVGRATAVLDAHCCMVLLKDAEGQATIAAASGPGAPHLPHLSARLDHTTARRLRGLLGVPEADVFFSIPVITGQSLQGLLVLHRPRTRPLTPQEELLLAGMADQVGLALALNAGRAGERSAGLRPLNGTKDNLIANLSHELRTPLAAILNSVQLLRQLYPYDDQQDRVHQIIDRNVHRMVRLIENLQDVSRMIRGKATLHLAPMDLRQTISTVCDEQRPAARRKGVELAVELQAEPLPIVGDAGRLRLMIGNLLDNAIRHSEFGGGVLVRLSSQANEAVLIVRDTGVGIPPERFDNLFKIQQRTDNGVSPSGGGLGVGLFVSRFVAEHHGGTIEAESEGRGKGAQFIVRLPLTPQPKLDTAPATEARTSTKSLRILVVEDDPDVRQTMAVMLELLGHTVVPAASGIAALEAAQQEHPHVALIDIGLPDIDGYQVARQLRQMPEQAELRLVAFTGYGSHEHQQRAAEAGFDAHLTKPLDLESLERALGASS